MPVVLILQTDHTFEYMLLLNTYKRNCRQGKGFLSTSKRPDWL